MLYRLSGLVVLVALGWALRLAHQVDRISGL
jgi:hypothetical protein